VPCLREKAFDLIHLSPRQHGEGHFIDDQSQIQVHSARSPLVVTHPSKKTFKSQTIIEIHTHDVKMFNLKRVQTNRQTINN